MRIAIIGNGNVGAVDAGPLKNTRHHEPLGFMNIPFGYVLGKGTEIAPRWQAA
jgi:hypothetical protein